MNRDLVAEAEETGHRQWLEESKLKQRKASNPMALTRATITRNQINEIQQMLDQGIQPAEVAASIARIADLDDLETITVRSVAYDLANGEAVRSADD